jgi:hypothetical protein
VVVQNLIAIREMEIETRHGGGPLLAVFKRGLPRP